MRFILYILFGVGGVLVALALGVVFFADDETAEVSPQTQSIDLSVKTASKPESSAGGDAVTRQADLTTADTPALGAQPSAEPRLGIEIARVKPDGAAVVAGSGPPGATISVFEDKILLGKTTANVNGEWVVVLEKRLGSGQHLISVAAELEDGRSIMAETSIAIEIYDDKSSSDCFIVHNIHIHFVALVIYILSYLAIKEGEARKVFSRKRINK